MSGRDIDQQILEAAKKPFVPLDFEDRKLALVLQIDRRWNDLSDVSADDFLFDGYGPPPTETEIYDTWTIASECFQMAACVVDMAVLRQDGAVELDYPKEVLLAALSFGTPWKEVDGIRIYKIHCDAFAAVDVSGDFPRLAGVKYEIDSGYGVSQQSFVDYDYHRRGIAGAMFECALAARGLPAWLDRDDGTPSDAGIAMMRKSIEKIWSDYALHEITDTSAFLAAHNVESMNTRNDHGFDDAIPC